MTQKCKDPFSAGQMIGMLLVLEFMERHNGLTPEAIDKLKRLAADKAGDYLSKPSEDIFLMIDNLVKEI